jgi:hypothetical protein
LDSARRQKDERVGLGSERHTRRSIVEDGQPARSFHTMNGQDRYRRAGDATAREQARNRRPQQGRCENVHFDRCYFAARGELFRGATHAR